MSASSASRRASSALSSSWASSRMSGSFISSSVAVSFATTSLYSRKLSTSGCISDERLRVRTELRRVRLDGGIGHLGHQLFVLRFDGCQFVEHALDSIGSALQPDPWPGPAGHRRKKRDLVAIRERRREPRVLFVHRAGDGGRVVRRAAGNSADEASQAVRAVAPSGSVRSSSDAPAISRSRANSRILTSMPARAPADARPRLPDPPSRPRSRPRRPRSARASRWGRSASAARSHTGTPRMHRRDGEMPRQSRRWLHRSPPGPSGGGWRARRRASGRRASSSICRNAFRASGAYAS